MNSSKSPIGPISQFFGSYGPDLLILGIIVAVASAISSASGIVANWVAQSIAGASLIALAAARFHQVLRASVYEVVKRTGLWLLEKLPIKTGAAIAGAVVLVVTLLVLLAVGVVTGSGGYRIAVIVAISVAVIGLGGHALWYRRLSAQWRAFNP
ncbi:MAG: hypothetical protein O3A10_05405 [Chloroflexi bacterium]|nr:hypothetical protein [Chloroflexota bacterium]MDA1147730.1 hypothetical protein [Chloroflexota bacterium]